MRSFAVYLIGIVVILGYNLIILTRLNGAPRLTTLASNACTLLDGPFSLLRKHAQTDFSSTYKLYDHRNCHDISAVGDFELVYRPVVGDHIHLGMVLSDEGRLHVLHDRNMSHRVSYEDDKYPISCPHPGSFAYEKRWYHTGVHTHCDGIVHVHPWSAPAQLRPEGRSVRLKLWFESVGIEVATNKSALKLPGAEHYLSGWRMEYYIHVNDRRPAFETDDILAMSNLWLVDHRALILLWRGSRPPRDFKVLGYPVHPADYPTR